MQFHTLEYVLRNRPGCLLKVYFEDGLIGYADCHPWTPLGDAPLPQQLQSLKNGDYTDLTRRSLHYARLDAEARHSKVSLFQGLKIPPSHYLVTDLQKAPIPTGFTHVKVKLGTNLPGETPQLLELMRGSSLKFRLDFNERLTQDQYMHFLKDLGPCCAQIDFCEDPFPYEPKMWEEVQGATGISLACDRQSLQAIERPRSAQVLVIKPAVQDPGIFSGRVVEQRIVFTSYLDHPLGQLAAAYEAAKIGVKEVCGLMTHLDCPEDPFAQQIGHQGNRLIPPVGTGFGFDELLEQFFSPQSTQSTRSEERIF